MVIQGEEGRARPDAIKGTREGEEGDLGLPRELSNQHGDTRIPGPGAWPLLSPAGRLSQGGQSRMDSGIRAHGGQLGAVSSPALKET